MPWLSGSGDERSYIINILGITQAVPTFFGICVESLEAETSGGNVEALIIFVILVALILEQKWLLFILYDILFIRSQATNLFVEKIVVIICKLIAILLHWWYNKY